MFDSLRARVGATTAVLCAIALVASIAVPASLAAGYGRGLFTGKAFSDFDNDRPRTPVEVKVKGKRVRITKLGLEFECSVAGGGVAKLNRTVASSFTRVQNGPAGGGAAANETVTPVGGGEPVDLTLNYGLRQKTVLGQVNATMQFDRLPCTDDVRFKANKR